VDFNQNYFEIFQLPVAFDLDVDELATRYRQLQASVHPDKFASATEHEKRLSLQWATQINGAYDTLRSDLARAIYLLELNDVHIEENPQLAPDFLMAQIELREQLDEIGEADVLDGSDGSLAKLETFKKEVNQHLGDYRSEFAAAYPDDVPVAQMAVYKLQFLGTLRASADKLEEKLLDY
tara:strand:- start:1990 stop:2529 length:540 start_codon:yes stop_codon:yes gene_type:complete